jgi:hypothetical protein
MMDHRRRAARALMQPAGIPGQWMPPGGQQGGLPGGIPGQFNPGQWMPPTVTPGPGMPGQQPGAGGALTPDEIRRQVMQEMLDNMRRANPGLWQHIGNLGAQARSGQLSGQERAAFLAPGMGAIQHYQTQARGELARDLSSRGLGHSSAMSSGLGQIAGQGATARAQLAADLFRQERERQDGAQNQLGSMLMGISSGQGGTAAEIGHAIRQEEIAQREASKQRKASFWQALLGTAGRLFAGGGF